MDCTDQSNTMDFTDIKNELHILSQPQQPSSQQQPLSQQQPSSQRLLHESNQQVRSLSWHEKLRLQTHCISTSDSPKNIITYANNKGLRNSIQFQQKPFYTFEELLIIINKLDEVWEDRLSAKENFSYFQ